MEELEKALEEMGMANEAAAAEQEAAPAPEPESAAGNSCSGPAGSLLLFLYSSAPFLSLLVPSGPAYNLATLCLWSPSLVLKIYSHADSQILPLPCNNHVVNESMPVRGGMKSRVKPITALPFFGSQRVRIPS